MATITKLEYNQSRPQNVRIAALEKAVDRLSVSVHQLQKTVGDQQQQLETANRTIASLRGRDSTT